MPIPATVLAAGTATASGTTSLVMLGLLSVGCWLLFSGSGHGGGGGHGGAEPLPARRLRPADPHRNRLLIGATATGSAAIHKVVAASAAR